MEGEVTEPVAVYRAIKRATCTERALVLQAIGMPFEVRPEMGAYTLLVNSNDERRARQELALYDDENRNWPPPKPKPLTTRGDGVAGVVAYVVVLLVIAYFQSEQSFGLEWRSAGKVDAGLIRGGEWWRTLTALTLHLDVAHLVANLVFGIAFGLFAGQLLGSGLAWSSILIGGALGNAINAMVQPAYHTAVGASTAVFAALGLLSAYTWRRRRQLNQRWAFRWGPVVFGIALLAYTGAGGERTDIVAHLTGFFSGFVLGAIYGTVGERIVPEAKGQFGLGAGAFFLLIVAWRAAF